MKAKVIGALVFGIFFATQSLAQTQASSELIEAAAQSSMGILHRDYPQSTQVVCSSGSWSSPLGCCAMPSGVCVTETYEVVDPD